MKRFFVGRHDRAMPEGRVATIASAMAKVRRGARRA